MSYLPIILFLVLLSVVIATLYMILKPDQSVVPTPPEPVPPEPVKPSEPSKAGAIAAGVGGGAIIIIIMIILFIYYSRREKTSSETTIVNPNYDSTSVTDPTAASTFDSLR